MRRLFLTIIALLVLVSAGSAQVSGVSLGYCNDEMKNSCTDGFSTTEKDTWVSAAIYLTEDNLKLFTGNHIDSLRAGLASSLNIDSLRVWVRSSLDGEDLASGAISKATDPKLAKGWNQIALDNPYTISEGQGLYIGMSYHQKSTSVGLSVVPNSQPNALYVQLGSNAEWTDRSSEGALAIEALVYGDKLPKYNLKLESVEVQPVYVIDKGSMSVTATVKNLATMTITGFDAVCKIDDVDETYIAHIDEAIAYGETKTVSFTINPSAITETEPENRTVTITIDNLNEGDDEDMSDNTLNAAFSVVSHDFSRNVLIEEFTTEKCPNCPRVAGYMSEVLGMERFNGRVNMICHHSGYYTDWLTIPSDNSYLWFYNMGGATFAPALLVDRATRPYISNNSETSPIYSPASADEIANVIDTRMLDVAFVSLKVSAEMDSINANEMTITVMGERIKENFTVNPPRINVVLIENDITPLSQAGSTQGFMHQHVSRAVNSTWGDEIVWEGNTYTYTCKLPLRNDYVRENLGIVAYIWDYDENDASKCEVANSSSISFKDFSVGTSTGISTLGVDMKKEVSAYYTIGGERVSQPVKGLNIVKYTDGSTRKIFIR